MSFLPPIRWLRANASKYNLDPDRIGVTGLSHGGFATCWLVGTVPPGTNTVNAVTRPGEQFALVTIAFKVGPSFKPGPMKRPSVTDTADKSYLTASQFVDVGSVPEYSCTFPFRLPEGTKLKALHIETATLDLAALDNR